ncbi:unnamed protein product [Linum tenue]|uniref:Protein kinase domain-containing protein n=4 Tax=Linum tenue TaxID=586396 RepID=A0AAV0J9Q8_9ROSI|nr:unnamed protein product [Linum tenue]
MLETKSPLTLAATAFILLLTIPISPSTPLHFNYTSFPDNSTSDFTRANAYITAGTIQITPDFIPNMSGRICYSKPFRLHRNRGHVKATFTTTFVLQINPKTQPPGEGMAFILTESPVLPGNSSGQWLGVVNSITNGSSSRGVVAVEFDSRKSYPEDLDDNHVGLDINSVYSVRQEPLSEFGVNLSASDIVTARVHYDGSNLTVLVSGRVVIWESIDLSVHLPEVVHVGFSGSTGRLNAQQNCILSWDFAGLDIGDGRFRSIWVWVLLSIGILGLIFGIVGFIYYQKRRKLGREKTENEGHPSIEEAIQGSSMAPLKFKVKELIDATKNFNHENKLGKGGFGTVYKGILRNREIAVKRVSKKVTSQVKQEFISEVTTIGNLHHKNLVKLIGWAHEGQEYLLVYEYMPNGSLDKLIFDDDESSSSSIRWETRLNIVSGVARALEYLHTGCEKRVLHRDIKASNIMLDSEFNAKLGDFGLARTIKQADQTHHSTKNLAGTLGYMAPEIFLTGRATLESDVYAFGILVLEVCCGRRPGGQLDQDGGYASSILNWVWELRGIGRLIDAADCRLKGDFVEEEMGCVLILGLACCHPDPFKRPTMKNVIQVLGREVAAPELPLERPGFMWPPVGLSSEGAGFSLVGSQVNSFTEITGR